MPWAIRSWLIASIRARSWPRGAFGAQGSTVVKSDQSGKSRSIVRQLGLQPGPVGRALGATSTMPCSVCLSQVVTMTPPSPLLPWNAKITGNSWLGGAAGKWMQKCRGTGAAPPPTGTSMRQLWNSGLPQRGAAGGAGWQT
jgi:hypothetical protein